MLWLRTSNMLLASGFCNHRNFAYTQYLQKQEAEMSARKGTVERKHFGKRSCLSSQHLKTVLFLRINLSSKLSAYKMKNQHRRNLNYLHIKNSILKFHQLLPSHVVLHSESHPKILLYVACMQGFVVCYSSFKTPRPVLFDHKNALTQGIYVNILKM